METNRTSKLIQLLKQWSVWSFYTIGSLKEYTNPMGIHFFVLCSWVLQSLFVLQRLRTEFSFHIRLMNFQGRRSEKLREAWQRLEALTTARNSFLLSDPDCFENPWTTTLAWCSAISSPWRPSTFFRNFHFPKCIFVTWMGPRST